VKSAAMVYAGDIVDEGVSTVLARLRDRGGLDGVELAAVYHHSRDVYPHNPVRAVAFPDGGAVFFRPDPSRYEGKRIQPRRARVLDDCDPLALLLDDAARQGMTVRAWTINLHNFALGEAYPDCATRNAFGDPLLTDLCPANPDVRAYARNVSADIARYGVESIVAESVCYMPYDHGFHHERSAYPLPEAVRFLLAMCFCPHCEAAGRRHGADVPRLRHEVAAGLRHAIAGEPSNLDGVPFERAAIASLGGGEMRGFLEAREGVVTSLVREVTAAVEAEGSTRFVFMDSMGADDAGDQSGPLVPDRSWRFGVDLPAVAAACHGISVMGYSRTMERFRADVEGYRAVLPRSVPLSIVLRAMPPDCLAAGDLPPKIAQAREWGMDWVEFYVYGLMRLSGLDWIREALAAQ
jgi:hypothetical protein